MSEPSFIEGVDLDSFEQFDAEGYSDEDVLVLAQGLLEDAVPCLKDIYAELSPALKKVAKFAVLEMATYLRNSHENFDAATSPFQSETLGSYSYNKLVRVVSSGENTGIPAFDRAKSLLGALCKVEGGEASATSEQVFKPGYDKYRQHREMGKQNVFISRWDWRV